MDLLFLIYPLVILIITFFGVRLAPKGEFHEDAWSLSDSKNLQAVAALFIVLHHLTQVISSYGNIDRGPITVFANMGIFFTAIFFFYSGYGLSRSFKEKTDYLNLFLIKRLPTVLLPFFILNVVYLIFANEGRVKSIADIVTSLLGFTLLNGNAWFIVEITIFYILFYLLYKNIKDENKARAILTAIVVVMIIVSLFLGHDQTSVGGHWFFGEWWYNSTILFPIGLYVGAYNREIKLWLKKNYKQRLIQVAVIMIVAFALEEFLRMNFGYYAEWPNHPGYLEKAVTLLGQSIGCIAFVAFLLVLGLKIHISNRVLSFLSTITLELYLVHGLLIPWFKGGTPYPEFLVFALIYAFGIAAGFILMRLDRSLKCLLIRK